MMRRRMRRKNVLRYRQKQKKNNNKNKQKKYVKLNITNKLLTKTPNRRNKLNRCQFDVDITSIHKKKQKKNYLWISSYFPILYRCNFLDEQLTSIGHTSYDVISMEEKSILFLQTLFNIISADKKSRPFSQTFSYAIVTCEKLASFWSPFRSNFD